MKITYLKTIGFRKFENEFETDLFDITSITVMVQKEVAERLTAKPGENKAGAITYTVSYYAVAENIINVSSESFVPAPEVASALIKLSIRKCSPVIVNDENKFFKLIKFWL